MSIWATRLYLKDDTAPFEHTLAVERIPRDRLPTVVVEFVNELGLGWMLERFYPEAM